MSLEESGGAGCAGEAQGSGEGLAGEAGESRRACVEEAEGKQGYQGQGEHRAGTASLLYFR